MIMADTIASRLINCSQVLLKHYEDVIKNGNYGNGNPGNAEILAQLEQIRTLIEAYKAVPDYETLYNEAMVASNETIRQLNEKLENANEMIDVLTSLSTRREHEAACATWDDLFGKLSHKNRFSLASYLAHEWHIVGVTIRNTTNGRNYRSLIGEDEQHD